MAIKKLKKSTTIKKTSTKEKISIGKDRLTRIEILRVLAEKTNLSKAQIEKIFFSLTDLIISHMRKKGSGEFIIPMTGIKIRRVKKKATKSRRMISPLTGKEVMIAGKPARHAIKISALKVLKSAVSD